MGNATVARLNFELKRGLDQHDFLIQLLLEALINFTPELGRLEHIAGAVAGNSRQHMNTPTRIDRSRQICPRAKPSTLDFREFEKPLRKAFQIRD